MLLFSIWVSINLSQHSFHFSCDPLVKCRILSRSVFVFVLIPIIFFARLNWKYFRVLQKCVASVDSARVLSNRLYSNVWITKRKYSEYDTFQSLCSAMQCQYHTFRRIWHFVSTVSCCLDELMIHDQLFSKKATNARLHNAIQSEFCHFTPNTRYWFTWRIRCATNRKRFCSLDREIIHLD